MVTFLCLYIVLELGELSRRRCENLAKKFCGFCLAGLGVKDLDGAGSVGIAGHLKGDAPECAGI